MVRRDSTRQRTIFGATQAWFAGTGVEAPGSLAPSMAEDHLAAAARLGHDHVRINSHINAAYLRFGMRLQALVDPSFAFASRRTRISPNWFTIGFHVSLTVGRSLAGVQVALELLDRPARPGSLTPREILSRLGLPAQAGWVARALDLGCRVADIPPEVGAILFGALQLNYGVLWNPVTIVTSLYRLSRLFGSIDGSIEERTRAILTTAANMLAEGNQAVYRDIGTAVDRYLAWREARPVTTAEDVLRQFAIGGSTIAGARRLFDLVLARPEVAITAHSLLDVVCPPAAGEDLLVAGLALYERARVELDAERASELVRAANSLLAFREQRDLLQPEFDEDRDELPGDDDGRRVFSILTPLLRVHFGTTIWNYAGGRFPTVGNWGVFEDRWPAIMAAFDAVYRAPEHVWVLPKPYVATVMPSSTGATEHSAREAHEDHMPIAQPPGDDDAGR